MMMKSCRVKILTDKMKKEVSSVAFWKWTSYKIYNHLTIKFLILLGDNREGEIPDPIPNSEVKPFIADGTAHKSVEE